MKRSGLAVAVLLAACSPRGASQAPTAPEASATVRGAVLAGPSASLHVLRTSRDSAPISRSPVAPPDHPFASPPTAPETHLSAVPGAAARTVRLHFPEADRDYGDCVSHAWVHRTLPAGAEPLDAVLRMLFTGPTAAEQAQSFFSPFTGKSSAHPAAPALIESYRGVVLRQDGTAVVEFTGDAMPILNAAACAQAAAKSAIELTLLQFREVVAVAYSIDGTIVEDWDA